MLKSFGNLLRLRRVSGLAKRTFLSESYKCTEAWEKRLKSPIFQKINYDDLYHNINTRFQSMDPINVMDVDLYCNGVTFESLPEIEELLRKLRENVETSIVHERTTHAVIRLYLQGGMGRQLLPILHNRLTYGLFLDNLLANILIDTFLKGNDIVSAVKVGVLQMLQEDLSHPIFNALTLHSCYKYLNSSEIWAMPKPPEEDNDDPVRVRVKFLRTPYFDDHFDLTDPNHLVGKTLFLCGKECDTPVGLSSQIVGLSLYEKFSDAFLLINSILKGNTSVHSEAVQKVKDYVNTKPKQAENEEKKKPIVEPPEILEVKDKLLKAIEQLEKKGNLIQESLETETEAMVNEAVKKNEEEDIRQQCKVRNNHAR